MGAALLVLLSTAVVFASLSLYHYLKEPLVAAAKSDLAAAEAAVFDKGWDGRSRLDLLLLKVKAQDQKIENLAVLTLDPANASLTLLEIPLNLLPLPGLEQAAPPLSLPQRLVTRLLGVPLDGYLWLDSEGERRLEEGLGGPLNFSSWRKLTVPWRWSKLPGLLAALKDNVRTNLSFLDLFSLARLGMAVRPDKVKEVTLTAGFFSNPGSGEQFLRETFAEEGMVEEGARILVLNGTEQSGLAAQAARLITHLGGYVLDTDNASRTDYTESLLLVGRQAPYTFRKLSEIFNVTKHQPVAAFSEDPLFSSMQRADLVLILGLDSVGRL